MSYSLDAITDDYYPETTVLINKLGIRDKSLLDEVEATLVSTKTVLWENNPLKNTYDFTHYKAIHQFLFEDLYDWAGQIRTVDISKKGTIFCPSTDIEEQAYRVFGRLLKYELYVNLDREEYLTEIVDFYCLTNLLHPFREGNGRTQRIFIAELINKAGYKDFNFASVNGDLLMIATIQSANGVTDLLKELFKKLIFCDTIQDNS